MNSMTRLGSLAVTAALLAPAAQAQRRESAGPAERCESTTCFNQLQIRDVEVITQTSLIVYVGAQRCPFFVEMTGIFCDLTFLPPFQVVFRPTRMASSRTAPIVGGLGSAPDGAGPVEQTRICAADIDMGLLADTFTSAVGEEGDSGGLSCRIEDVKSLTDDERLQIYVDNEMAAPPPPFGTGRVETPENPQEPEASPADEVDDSRGRRRNRDDDDNRRRRRRDADNEE